MRSIFSLAAQSHETPDHTSASHVAVERGVTTVASSPNLESSESIVIPQNVIPGSIYDWSNVEKEFEETLPSSIGHYKRKTLMSVLLFHSV